MTRNRTIIYKTSQCPEAKYLINDLWLCEDLSLPVCEYRIDIEKGKLKTHSFCFLKLCNNETLEDKTQLTLKGFWNKVIGR